MGRRFDIFGLPDLPFENIYQRLSFGDLILLAACSKRTKSFLRRNEVFMKKMTTCDFNASNSTRNFILQDVGRVKDRNEFKIDAWSEEATSLCLKMVIDGKPMEIQMVAGQWKVKATDVLFWFQFAKQLFNFCPKVTVDINDNFTQVTELFMETNALHVAEKMLLSCGRVHNDQMAHILDHVEAQELELKAKTYRSFEYEKLVNTKSSIITLYDPHWLSMEQTWEMVQSGVQRMDLQEMVSWTSWKFNRFIKKWLNSTNTSLEVLSFTFQKKMLHPSILFDGIETIPGARKRPDAASYFDRNIQYETGKDIRRKDGVMATLILQGGPQQLYSSFTVWYESNPNL